jgi:anti-anti-sigma regulatory factor
MLRITENPENKSIVRLRLDGTVSQETFDELAEVCARHQETGARTILLDMTGVNFMSHDAAQKLVRMRTESLRVINCSPFIAAVLDTAKKVD